ncbi:GNAT family N-acetyltransferase [Pseudoroseicyclus aestuarii]|uniref:Acetyltransferase (GNAT) family protein n=1 Tax=Pseudoroseicyclus aestuarii TaxID=1795041 RepID=A0A318T5X9_9RHOB|nr:GNAT family N-acetyltransferase [Pseudoroseicyclus aestuarii]PYE85814.1 acetyltransferase (GNAT) family protein [Pseudoroseicyclus aestuarii]
MITLSALTDRGEVLHLAPAPEQMEFAGSAESILSDPRPHLDFHVIREAGKAVGLFKIDRAYEDGRSFAGPGTWGLRGVMIDQHHQGRGIGRAAFAALPGYLR